MTISKLVNCLTGKPMNQLMKYGMDEDVLDVAAGHADASRREQWHGLRPDEWAMLEEDGMEEEEWSMAGATGTLLAFLFADGAEDWRKVATRAAAVIRRYALGRAERMDLSGFPYFTGWGMEEFVALVGEENKGKIGRIVGWFYNADGRTGMRAGTERLYLFALVIDPQLLRWPPDEHVAGGEWKQMGFVECEVALEGDCFAGLPVAERKRKEAVARSKWSARAGKIRAEFERAGGAFAQASFYGKSAESREKYRAAAMGNRNRKGK